MKTLIFVLTLSTIYITDTLAKPAECKLDDQVIPNCDLMAHIDTGGSDSKLVITGDVHTLPTGFGAHFPRVTYLVVQDTNITALPEDFGQGMGRLEQIWLNKNPHLTTLPAIFATGFPALKEFHITDSQIIHYPENFGAGMTTLRRMLIDESVKNNLPHPLIALQTRRPDVKIQTVAQSNLEAQNGTGHPPLLPRREVLRQPDPAVQPSGN